MSFISYLFLILFAVTLAARFTFGRHKNEKSYLVFLLAASLVFYGSYIPSYLVLLFGITAIDYWAGRKIFEAADSAGKKKFLLISIVSNMGLLGFYKYAQFFLENLKLLLGWLGYGVGWDTHFDLPLPLGISFFTFQSLSYTIDLYRGTIQPVQRYWRFLLFVSFFTHLVSGPIVRAKELVYQFDRKREVRLQVSTQGVYLMVRGFFLKMVVADNLASYVNKYWDDSFILGGSSSFSLLLAFLFACQIYADFDGYTSIARGSALLLGFKLPENFNAPYIAQSFREFWSRWHMTLSHWMRDYLYRPLGGNRGSKLRTCFNLFLTMVLAGLWHGAAFTFVIWGAIHGLALVLERGLGLHRAVERSRVAALFYYPLVQGVVLLAWTFFRAQTAHQAIVLTANVFSGYWGWEMGAKLAPALAFTLPVILIHARSWLNEGRWLPALPLLEKGFWCALMLYSIFSIYGDASAFLYFRF